MVKDYAGCNMIYNDMVDPNNKMGFLLSKDNTFIRLLSKDGRAWGKRVRLFNEKSEAITIEIWPLFYDLIENDKEAQEKFICNLSFQKEIVHYRMGGVSTLFLRWDACGENKRSATSPFSSKMFNTWLDSMGYQQADYLLLWVN